jgi:polyisoprenoid-binding protein YceI
VRVSATEIGHRGVVRVVVGLLALFTVPVRAAEGPAWRLERGDVRVVVPVRPGGAFEARTSSLGGTLTLSASTPVILTGDITVDLATIDTGIALRNQHLRENYLQLAKGPGFDKAVLSGIRVNDADGAGFQGRTGFTGTLLLHGVRREVAGTGEIRREGSAARVEASFPLTLTDFGVQPPEYLGVGVANKLLVKVVFTATPTRGTGE